MVLIVHGDENRLIFLYDFLFGWDVFFVVQNCDFFAEIWAQGDFCVFLWRAWFVRFVADFWVFDVDLLCVLNVKIVKNFFIIFFRKFSDFFMNFLCGFMLLK